MGSNPSSSQYCPVDKAKKGPNRPSRKLCCGKIMVKTWNLKHSYPVFYQGNRVNFIYIVVGYKVGKY